MKIIADTHTHTLASDHAYSTHTENAKAASEAGLKFLCSTEHTPSLLGSPSVIHFRNLGILPRYLYDVMVIRGAEVNIIDYNGNLDIEESVLKNLEWRIASLHIPCIKPGTKLDHTNAWLNIAENPYINVIGHCGDGRYDFDHEVVLKSFAKNGKIVEINSHSSLVRPDSAENCPKIARLCAEYNIPVVVSSDAHFHTYIGEFNEALKMLDEIGFPEELIINADYDKFLERLHFINGGKLEGEV